MSTFEETSLTSKIFGNGAFGMEEYRFCRRMGDGHLVKGSKTGLPEMFVGDAMHEVVTCVVYWSWGSLPKYPWVKLQNLYYWIAERGELLVL